MTCVDCSKTFPTPDALQRHRYIHSSIRQLFKCDVCGEMAAFESDMKHHKAKHIPTKNGFVYILAVIETLKGSLT